MFGQDLGYVIWWWGMFFVAGIVSLPLTWLIFKRFFDIGYGFSKTIAFIVVAYIAFLGATFHIFTLSRLTYLIIFLAFLTLNYFIFSKHKQKIFSDLADKKKILILSEVLFSFGLLFWSYIRSHQPEIRGLEKFMDFGFINSVLRSDYLPPVDMWFSGKPINYYWFGHYFTAFLTRLSGIPSSITYNLMLATILGLTLSGAFSIVTTLVSKISDDISFRTIKIAGLVSAVLLAFGGNFHTPFYVLKNGAQKYWYPDATRFIGYNPDVPDKTIHEFPMYSFVVADLHPHLINLPIVLLFLALLLNQIYSFKKSNNFSKFNLIIMGFILGVMFATSTWDFGNYLITSSAVFGLFYFLKHHLSVKAIWETGKLILIIILIGLLTASPFIFNFESIAQGIYFVHSRTPIWQISILWGFPAILTICFIYLIYKIWPKLESSDIFVLGVLIASWILIFIPEIIFVKDIYIDAHYRANTMFKLTYQAFVMFYLSSGYVFIRTVTSTKQSGLKSLVKFFYIFIFSLILIYPYFSTKGYYGDLKIYHGINGEAWLTRDYPNEYAALEWFRKNVKNQPVILEAPGDSYTDFNVISSYSGLPTVSGWFVHEWLWRGSAEAPQARVTDIVQIYTNNDLNETKRLLDKYNVEYVIVGTFERQKYPNINESKFDVLGTLVFSQGNTEIYKLKR